MLRQEVIDKLVDKLVERIENTNRYILEEIANAIRMIGEVDISRAESLVQILKYGGDYNKIAVELAKMTNLNVEDIDKIFEGIARNNYQFAEKYYLYKDVNYLPYEQNLALISQVEAITRTAVKDYINLSKTSAIGYGLQDMNGNVVFTGIQDTYNQIIDEAIISIRQGKETFNSVMNSRLKELAHSGLKVIYPSTYLKRNDKGELVEVHRTRRLDTAVRMNVNDGINQLHNATQEIIGEQIQSDGVEITVHFNPAPDHEKLQGKQFSNEEYEQLNMGNRAVAYDKTVIGTDLRRRPIGELNCQHRIYKVILGVDNPSYTNEELERIREVNNKGFTYEDKHYTNYEGEQLLRQVQLKIREQEDIKAMGSVGDRTELLNSSSKKLRLLRRKEREIKGLIRESTKW